MSAKIDVIMITKNSEKPCLRDSLDSIIRNIPLNRLIVVDSFSTDGSIKIIDDLNINKKIIQANASRGKAREIGVGEVETDFFAFVDSDVILSDEWYENIITHLWPNTGAIEGNVRSREGTVQKIRQNDRAYTNCTLVRTESIKGINIPEEITVYEDQYIRRYIEGRHFEWVKVGDPCSTHLSTSIRVRDAYEIGRIGGKYGLVPLTSRVTSFGIVLAKRFFHFKGDDPGIHLRMVKGHIAGWFERQRG